MNVPGFWGGWVKKAKGKNDVHNHVKKSGNNKRRADGTQQNKGKRFCDG